MIVNEVTLKDFQVEIGDMDYGMEIDGILGLNFLKQAGAVIDTGEMQLKTNVC
ncbi:hypothetical protein D3C81_2128860 [compost metagenome]